MRYGVGMETESNTPEPQSRTYVVGLPVIVTVSPEGYVTVDVDLSDLGTSIARDEFTEYDTDTAKADGDMADAFAKGHAVRNEGWVR